MLNFNKLINKTILVGLTYKNNTEIIKLSQFFGKIISSDKVNGITVLKNNSDELFSLPPDLSAIKKAPKGFYTLKETNETIKNPDYLSTWIIEHDN